MTIKGTGKNRFKSFISTDRYGTEYIKNFTIWADGHTSLQTWTSVNPKVKTIMLGR